MTSAVSHNDELSLLVEDEVDAQVSPFPVSSFDVRYKIVRLPAVLMLAHADKASVSVGLFALMERNIEPRAGLELTRVYVDGTI